METDVSTIESVEFVPALMSECGGETFLSTLATMSFFGGKLHQRGGSGVPLDKRSIPHDSVERCDRSNEIITRYDKHQSAILQRRKSILLGIRSIPYDPVEHLNRLNKSIKRYDKHQSAVFKHRMPLPHVGRSTPPSRNDRQQSSKQDTYRSARAAAPDQGLHHVDGNNHETSRRYVQPEPILLRL